VTFGAPPNILAATFGVNRAGHGEVSEYDRRLWASTVARKLDIDLFEDVPAGHGLPGWKAFGCWWDPYLARPVLGGLCQVDARYPGGDDRAVCSGFPDWAWEPCDDVPGWGCPRRCGYHSNRTLFGARSGDPQFVVGFTRSHGRVVRGTSPALGEPIWRSERFSINHLFVSKGFVGGSHSAFVGALQGAYRVPVTMVGRRSADRFEPSPFEVFVEAADKAGLPAVYDEVSPAG
jgi:hypothetical protein